MLNMINAYIMSTIWIPRTSECIRVLIFTRRSSIAGSQINDSCGIVLHGNSAVFCEHKGLREITTVPLNMTTAATVQFAIGRYKVLHDGIFIHKYIRKS